MRQGGDFGFLPGFLRACAFADPAKHNTAATSTAAFSVLQDVPEKNSVKRVTK
jgi:hypothetical protein